LPGKKALIVISSGRSMKANGYLQIVEEELNQSGIDHVVYNGVSANPVLKEVEDGAACAKENGCDFIVGLGGGSSLDCAKAIALAATNPGDFWDYNKGKTGKHKKYENLPLPVVAITTTAGTGSEIDPWFVITKPETNEKSGTGFPPYSYPMYAIVDPDLMMTVPAKLTAYQGFDTLFHAAESAVNKNEDVFAEMFALQAVSYVGKYLARAVNHGDDKEARTYMALANTLAGMYMNCTSEHSLEHELSSHHPDVPHGAGLIMISKAWFQTMVEYHACDEQLIKLAKALGKEDADDARDFIDALQELQETCHVADLKMSDYGIANEEIPEMVKSAREMGGLFRADPIILSDEDLIKIYEISYR
jgi:alcohol dehydrogenase